MMRATLKDSDDLAAAEKNIEMVAKMAWRRIWLRKKSYVLCKRKNESSVGRCCHYGCNENKLTPGLIHGLFAKIARKQFADARNQ